jgi:hypothetical protein
VVAAIAVAVLGLAALFLAERRPRAITVDYPLETQVRYDLYRIPFKDGRGGEPVPITGASGNGMSNSFPKVSPDGRWIVFVQAGRLPEAIETTRQALDAATQASDPRLVRDLRARLSSYEAAAGSRPHDSGGTR